MKNYPDALHDLTKSISIYPKYAKTHFKKGFVFLLERKYSDAIIEFDIAISINSNILEYHFNKGMALANLNKYNDALKCFDMCLTINADDIESQYNKGLCLVRTGAYQQALDIFLHFFENNCNINFPEVYYNIGYCYSHLGNDEEAVIYYDKCTNVSSDYVEAYNQKGQSYFNMELYQEAIIEFNKVILMSPTDSEVYYLKGKCLMEMKRFSEASMQFKKCLTYNTNHLKAHFRKGFCHIKCNEFTNGLNEFNICLGNKEVYTKLDSEILFYKGICLYGMRQINSAVELFEKIIELNDGKHEEAEEYKRRCEISIFRKELKEKQDVMKSARHSLVYVTCPNGLRYNIMNDNENIIKEEKEEKVYSTGSNKSTSESGNDEKID